MVGPSVIQLGMRYERPDDAGPAWFYSVLAEERRTRLGSLPIVLELLSGGTVAGPLEGVGEPPAAGGHGSILLDAGDQVAEFPCEDLAAFTLIDDEPPIDHSDELRGG